MSDLIKVIHSGQASCPAVSGTAGALEAFLYAALVTGFGSKSVDSITRSGSTATVTISAGHSFTTNDTLLIAGADQSEYNIEFKPLSVTGTQFTYAVTGTPATPATGTITVKIAPLGWERAYSGTNKGAYRSLNAQGTQRYLRVDDSNAQYALLNMYEAMTAIDSGSGASATKYWKKSDTSNADARSTYIIGDDKTFHLFIAWYSSYPTECSYHYFGDAISYKVGDVYNCLLSGYPTTSPSYPGSTGQFDQVNAVSNIFELCRSYTGIGGTIIPTLHSLYGINTMGRSGAVYPNGPDSGLHLARVYIHEPSTVHRRGILRGLLAPLNVTNGAFASLDYSVNNPAGLSRPTVAMKIGANNTGNQPGNVFLDNGGPWDG